eukprot:CAMPEP_0115540744 /NCGR_PEP_ID=MMETSP0271-20121206/90095_1 /TAXON_ID=71861 /ORGANISM="Scrippsiella trochoidea, Strain CCMP3099" /LENGTH=242 /DNA_ID=CAMNT_0002973767 /DNA_START=553 /DNA_END=1282 /DNA_ORIENTATION=-
MAALSKRHRRHAVLLERQWMSLDPEPAQRPLRAAPQDLSVVDAVRGAVEVRDEGQHSDRLLFAALGQKKDRGFLQGQVHRKEHAGAGHHAENDDLSPRPVRRVRQVWHEQDQQRACVQLAEGPPHVRQVDEVLSCSFWHRLHEQRDDRGHAAAETHAGEETESNHALGPLAEGAADAEDDDAAVGHQSHRSSADYVSDVAADEAADEDADEDGGHEGSLHQRREAPRDLQRPKDRAAHEHLG